MKQPEYLKAFQAAREHIVLKGNYLIVERAPWDELKSKSGIILSIDNGTMAKTLASDMPVLVHVLAVGEGYASESGEDTPLDTRPGDILMVGRNSVKWFPSLPLNGYKADSVGITSETEMQIRWAGVAGYGRYARALEGEDSGTPEKEVE